MRNLCRPSDRPRGARREVRLAAEMVSRTGMMIPDRVPISVGGARSRRCSGAAKPLAFVVRALTRHIEAATMSPSAEGVDRFDGSCGQSANQKTIMLLVTT